MSNVRGYVAIAGSSLLFMIGGLRSEAEASSNPKQAVVAIHCVTAGQVGPKGRIPACKTLNQASDAWVNGRLEWYSGSTLLYVENGPFYFEKHEGRAEVQVFIDGNGDPARFATWYLNPLTSVYTAPELWFRLWIQDKDPMKPAVLAAEQSPLPVAAALWSVHSEDTPQLVADIAAERAAREAADVALQAQLSGPIAAQIAGEIARAKAAEATLQGSLDAEVTLRAAGDVAEAGARAAAVAALDAALAAEVARAGLAESQLSMALQAGDAALDAALASERAARIASDAASTSALSGEIAARKQGDVDLLVTAKAYADTQVALEAAARLAGDTGAASALAVELARAQAAESALAMSIGVETSRAQAAESALGMSIGLETSRAQAAESALGTSIVFETNRAQTAEDMQRVALMGEALARQGADTALQGTVGALSSSLSAWQAQLAAVGTLNNAGNPVDWSELKNVPAHAAVGYTQGAGISINGANVVANTGVLGVSGGGVLSSTGGQNPTISLNGVVPIVNGGTGIFTAPTGAGQYLRSSGPGTWAVGAIQAADVPGLSNYVDLSSPQNILGVKTFASTINGSINGNAGTVTNGLYSTGLYANPPWITSLAGAKITGTVPSAAAFTGLLVGDVSGTQGATVVGGIQGRPVDNAPPLHGQVLRYNGATARWEPSAPGNVQACSAGAVLVSTGNGNTQCQLQCGGGNGDCNANPADGCEQDITTNSLHCGGCGNVCPVAQNNCVLGHCTICPSGFQQTAPNKCLKLLLPADLSNAPSTCSPNPSYYGCNGAVGFKWVDDGSVAPTRIDLDFNQSVACIAAPSVQAITLNGSNVGSYTQQGAQCTCSATTQATSTVLTATGYAPNAVNTLQLQPQNLLQCQGWAPNANWSNALGRLTLTY